MSESTIKEKRRQLLDAIYAIHVGGGVIRVDVGLAHRLQVAWDEYDAALTERLRVALSDLLELHEDELERPAVRFAREVFGSNKAAETTL